MQSVIQSNWNECFMCHGIPTDVHHCLRGKYRPKAEEFKLVIHVCRKCHTRIHENQEIFDCYRMLAQRVFESKIGDRYMWRKNFGRSYL